MTQNTLAQQLTYFTSNWVQATQEPFSGHNLAQFFRNEVQNSVASLVHMFNPSYLVKASVGAGNWANIPWISILNPNLTDSTQDGIYPVYLFRADGSGFYLSLNQGTTVPTQTLGKTKAEHRANYIQQYVLAHLPQLSNWGQQTIDLRATTSLGKSYESYNIIAKYYDAHTELSEDKLKNDLSELLGFYQEIETIYQYIESLDFDSSEQPAIKETPKNYKNISFNNLTQLSKPFLLLAGISGTGKTRFVREQAKVTGSLSETYCLTSVRPDWHEPSDLLGYISRLSGHAQYVTTDVLKFIAKAWHAIIDADLDIVVDQDNRLSVLGNKEELEQIRPYWLCLDEMNLAPVEQYFADYLSILETREWQWTDDEFQYRCDAILKPTVFNQVANIAELRQELGFEDGIYDEVWALFCQHGMSLPFNLIVAGTVNMDETTHGFSRKVIDRALSFDFGDFFPNDFDHFFNPVVQHKTLSYPIYSHASPSDLPTIDSTGQKSIAFLKAVNHVLDNTPFKLAFRALNELLLSVISTNPTSDVELQAVWDDFLMCKVLPRIDGDHDKLMLIQQSNDSNQLSADGILSDTLLTELSTVLKRSLSEIWDEPEARPDLYRQAVNDNQNDTRIGIACRSKAKLEWMQQRLQRSGFTNFWP
ncbi:DUF3578 domain-containing protein [Psychrobacter sp. YP14]|uniref:MrcB family domain-containing protein n=1 Tax=Psychrobacter sp. YP14 TaxID=2203895 RepID=UPI000D7DA753|nr:DUF3578 domain-containing protein [Psychrobacter sp. YP14]AWT49635.1 DUF3578 domain-containing protein [Psychrobacter sp. YP14]